MTFYALLIVKEVLFYSEREKEIKECLKVILYLNKLSTSKANPKKAGKLEGLECKLMTRRYVLQATQWFPKKKKNPPSEDCLNDMNTKFCNQEQTCRTKFTIYHENPLNDSK